VPAVYNIRWLLRAIARKGMMSFVVAPATSIGQLVVWLAQRRDEIALP
jgi:hypothetical protein